MKPRQEKVSGEDLFRSRLDAIVDMRHPLVILAGQFDWANLDLEYGALYAEYDRPGVPTRLMIGLEILKHTYGLSDEGVCARWAENPYYQYLTGEEFFCHELPCDRSSMSNWRKSSICCGRIERRLDGCQPPAVRIEIDFESDGMIHRLVAPIRIKRASSP